MVFRSETLSQKDALDCALPQLNGDSADLPEVYSEAIFQIHRAESGFPSGKAALRENLKT
jgi:hypothetical protein